MLLRGEISYWTPGVPEKAKIPIDTDRPQSLPYSHEWYALPPHLADSPEHQQMAAVRAHCIEYPQAVLLDVYQELTALSLAPSLPPRTVETQRVLLEGLRNETTELSSELKIAELHHPYNHIVQSMEEDEDVWLHSVLPFHHLRFFQLEPQNKEHFLSEAGDSMWYAARVAQEMNTSLSGAFFKFLHTVDTGALRSLTRYHSEQAQRQRFAKIMDFDLVQTISLNLADKVKFTLNRGIPNLRHDFTAENNPIGWLDALVDRGLYPDAQMRPETVGRPEEWDASTPYSHLPDLELAIGKLVWFNAYTASTILNSDFRTTMQASLQKNVRRTQRDTILNKDGRTQADEPAITASPVPRNPLQA